MFERYTEKVRRAIFFARYEASRWKLANGKTSLRAYRDEHQR